MVKETNKSTTIILLVIAGALLFLVGSFTGHAMYVRLAGQACGSYFQCTTGLECVSGKCQVATTEDVLTVTQASDVLLMLQRCQVVNIGLTGVEVTGYDQCRNNKMHCIISIISYPLEGGDTLTKFVPCSSGEMASSGKSILCCQP